MVISQPASSTIKLTANTPATNTGMLRLVRNLFSHQDGSAAPAVVLAEAPAVRDVGSEALECMREQFDEELKLFRASKQRLNVFVSAPFHVPVNDYLRQLAELLGGEQLQVPLEHHESQYYHQMLASANQERMDDTFSFHLQTMLAQQYRFMYRPSNTQVRLSNACSLDEVFANAEASLRCGLISKPQLATLRSIAQNLFLVQNENLEERHSLFVLLQPSAASYENNVVQLLDDRPIQDYYRQSLKCLSEHYDGMMAQQFYSLVVPLERFQSPDQMQTLLLGYSILHHVMRLHSQREWGLPASMRFSVLANPVERLARTVKLPTDRPLFNVVRQPEPASTVAAAPAKPVLTTSQSARLPAAYSDHQQAHDRLLARTHSTVLHSTSDSSLGSTFTASTRTPQSTLSETKPPSKAPEISNAKLQQMRTISWRSLRQESDRKHSHKNQLQRVRSASESGLVRSPHILNNAEYLCSPRGVSTEQCDAVAV